MRYREHAPSAALGGVVECFWEITGSAPSHRVLPDGAMDLLFGFGDSSPRVIGPMTRAIVTRPAPGTWIVGARFVPGAALGALGVAACELRDATARATDVWGPRGSDLAASLASSLEAARAPGDAIAAIGEAIASRTVRGAALDPRISHAVATIRSHAGTISVPAVAAGAGLSERQLERLFRERVGYGPKAFARIVRLQHAARVLDARAGRRGSLASWARVAAECGYADQPHLIREFHALAGVTPEGYEAERMMSEIDNRRGGPVDTVGA